MKFSEIKSKIVNNPGFKNLAEIRRAGYRIVKERDGERYFLAKQDELKPLLVRLGDIAEVRRGFTTGANEFFYLQPVEMSVAEVAKLSEENPSAPVLVKNGAGWEGEIEAEFLKPVIKSPREIKTIRVRLEDLRYLVFMCPLSKEELKKQGKLCALEYIQWGELQGYHKRPTCASRERWWDFGKQEIPLATWFKAFNDRFFVPHNAVQASCSDRLYAVYPRCKGVGGSQVLVTSLNSSFNHLIAELTGRVNLGEGALDNMTFEAAKNLVLAPSVLTFHQCECLLRAFELMAEREVKAIFEELGLPKPNRDYSNINPEKVSLDKVFPDRRELDAVIFEVLGLTEEEQLAVYRAVVELVKNRLVKARSI